VLRTLLTDRLCCQLVGELLQHQVADRGQPLPTESWKDAMVERLPVGAHGRRLVSITGPGPGDRGPGGDGGMFTQPRAGSIA
jgi:hypothetical protein